MLSRVFATVTDLGYFPGVQALLNSIWAYHRREIPVFLYHRGLGDAELAWLGRPPCEIRLFEVDALPFTSFGMWEAKQQVFAHCLGQARAVYLLDADLVLVSS